MLRSRQSLLASGILTAAAGGWSTILALVTVPLMVHGLGTSAYGLYSVAFSVAALGSYLDLGLGWTTAKFVAEADGSRDRLASILATAVLYHSAFGLIFAGAIVAAAPWIVRDVLHIGGASADTAATLLRLTAGSFLAASLLGVFISALRGVRRFAMATLIGTASTTCSSAGAAAMATFGFGPIGAALAQFGGIATGAALAGITCYPLLRHARLNDAMRRDFRAMVGFSVWSYGSRLIQMVMLQWDKLLIARWLGPAALTFYAVPFNFAQRVNVLAGPAVTAVYPVAAAAQGDPEVFLRQYLTASRLLHMTTAALAITVLTWGDRFLDAWVGGDMATHGAPILRVLAIGFWLVSVGSFDGSCVEGWNRPRLTFLLSALGVILGSSLALAAWWAGSDIRLATALAIAGYSATAGVGQMIGWYRIARYPLEHLVRRVALPIAEMGALAVVATSALRPIVHGSFAAIAVFFALIGALAVYGVWRAMSRFELRTLGLRVLSPFAGAA
jgi:O-antigen/teichoic acid export membrane protein